MLRCEWGNKHRIFALVKLMAEEDLLKRFCFLFCKVRRLAWAGPGLTVVSSVPRLFCVYILSLTGPDEEVLVKLSGSKKGGKSWAKEPHSEKMIPFKSPGRSYRECGLTKWFICIHVVLLLIWTIALISGSLSKSHHLHQTFLPALLMLPSLCFTT